MKKLWAIALLLLLSACGDTSEEVDPAEIESRIAEALKQMGDDTNLSIIDSKEIEDGRHVISLSNDTMFFVEGNEVTVANNTSAIFTEREDIDFSFLLLAGVADDSLTAGEKSEIVAQLGLMDNEINITDHSEVTTYNDVQYTYLGNEEALMMRATLK